MSTPLFSSPIGFGRLNATRLVPDKTKRDTNKGRTSGEPLLSVNVKQEQLETRFKQAARRETAYNTQEYDQLSAISSLAGHCNAVAYCVQKLYGGVILQATVHYQLNGKPKRTSHFWNRLPNGIEIDYSASQWGLTNQIPLSHKQLMFPLQKSEKTPKGNVKLIVLSVSPARIVPSRKTVNPRFTQFEENFQKTS
ncbi:MAG: hypothetical protein K2X01_04320 [Cyanobacteria bacterium]|nr:hypothetical protein [Cyanobacteriota bacterium]